MRRILACLAVTAVLAGGTGCSSSKDTPAAQPSAPATSAAPAPSAAPQMLGDTPEAVAQAFVESVLGNVDIYNANDVGPAMRSVSDFLTDDFRRDMVEMASTGDWSTTPAGYAALAWNVIPWKTPESVFGPAPDAVTAEVVGTRSSQQIDTGSSGEPQIETRTEYRVTFDDGSERHRVAVYRMWVVPNDDPTGFPWLIAHARAIHEAAA